MKRNLLHLLTILLISAATFQCNRSGDDDTTQLVEVLYPIEYKPAYYYKAKIIRITCASTAIQILDKTSLGDMDWKDKFNNDRSYNHVFNALNRCKIPAGYKEGDVIYVSLDLAKPVICASCYMMDYPPASEYIIVAISRGPFNAALWR